MTGPDWVIALPVVLPLLAALALALPEPARGRVIRLAPWLPLSLLLPWLAVEPVHAPALLLGLALGIDAVAAPLVLLCSIAWTLAGWFAAGSIVRDRRMFWGGWLLSLAGISLALLALDLAGFYAGYAMLSLASWLLIVHARTAEAWRAGRVYLVLALAGEMAVFAGVMAIAAQGGNVALPLLYTIDLGASPRLLILAGFAVKMGIIPLHLWLPLAHPVAPVPASAILSGVIVKAGLLGWLRLAPPGIAGGEALAAALIPIGLATAFVGVVLGLTQQRVKVILAYSTISQMGLVLCLYAALLSRPDQAVVALPWLGVLVLHHGLNKAALFLSCGCSPGRSWLRRLLVAVPALSLAGAPLMTGMLAKAGIKQGFAAAGLGAGWILALSLSSTATALLLWHFWQRVTRDDHYTRAHPAWIAMTLAALGVPWAWLHGSELDPHLLHGLWPATWPLLLAAVILAAWRRMRPGRCPALPPGDLVVPLEAGLAGLGRVPRRLAERRLPTLPNLYRLHVRIIAVFLWAERKMSAMPVAGALILGVGGLLWWVSVAS